MEVYKGVRIYHSLARSIPKESPLFIGESVGSPIIYLYEGENNGYSKTGINGICETVRL